MLACFDPSDRGFLSEVHALGIDRFLHQQGLDATIPAGKVEASSREISRTGGAPLSMMAVSVAPNLSIAPTFLCLRSRASFRRTCRVKPLLAAGDLVQSIFRNEEITECQLEMKPETRPGPVYIVALLQAGCVFSSSSASSNCSAGLGCNSREYSLRRFL
jgi:hypothetical protein